MGISTWIGGALGFMMFGPLGALAGAAIGSLLDDGLKQKDGFKGDAAQTASDEMGQRNSFMFSLLVLASYVIKADGKVMHSEMEYVRQFLRNSFGPGADEQGNDILLHLFEEQKRMDQSNPYAYKQTIFNCCDQIRNYLTEEQSLQLLSFLVGIAKSDGRVDDSEVQALKELAAALGLSAGTVDSMLHLGGASLDDAYKVLQIDPSATDAEVKAAYRKLALKYHPDRVATLGEDVRKAAEQKFQELNNAKERIYKARSIS